MRITTHHPSFIIPSNGIPRYFPKLIPNCKLKIPRNFPKLSTLICGSKTRAYQTFSHYFPVTAGNTKGYKNLTAKLNITPGVPPIVIELAATLLIKNAM